jgi:hypothetical protein
MLQRDILDRIEALSEQQRVPLMVLLEAVANQAQGRYSNKEIEQRVILAIHEVLAGRFNED